jgi:hypothetical protein
MFYYEISEMDQLVWRMLKSAYERHEMTTKSERKAMMNIDHRNFIEVGYGSGA